METPAPIAPPTPDVTPTPAVPASVQIFGIRHHGPGSARSLRQALMAWRPDCLLVEGPPEAAEVLPLLTHAAMKPPVALLLYVADRPRLSCFDPFAVFSPEWQALDYALRAGIPVRFMDLPQTHRLALDAPPEPAGAPEIPENPPDTTDPTDLPADDPTAPEAAPESPAEARRRDPLGALAAAAGYADGERWWEHLVETRQESTDLFAAILEAMTALRATTEPLPADDPSHEALREAYMRQTLRAAKREGFQRIAVVCGAWHAPALATLPPAGADAALLKGLPKLKVKATWVPWTHGRLTSASGYGAGITSPGWYDHLWTSSAAGLAPQASAIRWLTSVAQLLRREGLDISPGHVIEAVRLSEALAALRQQPVPGLEELQEACATVLCQGETLPLAIIHRKLIVGETLGAVPAETPQVPLQQDLAAQQKRLRLAPDAVGKALDLDLRKDNDLARSHLLHRLRLLGVPWGTPQRSAGTRGTFHELWDLRWQPEFAVALIEAAVWGNSVGDAAAACASDHAAKADALPALSALLEVVLLAELPAAATAVTARLSQVAAVTSDVALLMDALPPLANVVRYGNVRQTDTAMVSGVVSGLVTRIAIGLPAGCRALNDEAAAALLPRFLAVDAAVLQLAHEPYTTAWHAVLRQLADQQGLHGLLAGRCCRILLDHQHFAAAELARRMSLATSTASDPAQAAAWVEGFLQGSGLLLLHDATLWQVLDQWLTGLRPDAFTQVLPLLRRTFATFPAPERRQLGERAKDQSPTAALASAAAPTLAASGATTRADQVLPVVLQLLGLPG